MWILWRNERVVPTTWSKGLAYIVSALNGVGRYLVLLFIQLLFD